MKITKTVTETKEIEVDITFPYYCKDICHYYKILDEDTAVSVFKSNYSVGSIAIFSASVALNDSEPCTEKEFKAAFNLVKKRLTNLIK